MTKKVERDIGKRWERGVPHHHKSIEIMDALEYGDWHYCDDSFCFKRGGDGDNGEALQFILDIYFDCLDSGENFFDQKER